MPAPATVQTHTEVPVRAELEETAAATVTVGDAADVWDSATVALSVTWSLKAYVSPTVKVPARIEQVSVAPGAAPVPLPIAQTVAGPYALPFTETSHVHAYEAVPVEGIVPTTVRVCVTWGAVAFTVGAAGAVSAEFTVTVGEAVEVALSGPAPLLSTRVSSKL